MLQCVTHANKQIEKECNIWCSFYCQFIEDDPDIAIAALRGNFICGKLQETPESVHEANVNWITEIHSIHPNLSQQDILKILPEAQKYFNNKKS